MQLTLPPTSNYFPFALICPPSLQRKELGRRRRELRHALPHGELRRLSRGVRVLGVHVLREGDGHTDEPPDGRGQSHPGAVRGLRPGPGGGAGARLRGDRLPPLPADREPRADREPGADRRADAPAGGDRQGAPGDVLLVSLDFPLSFLSVHVRRSRPNEIPEAARTGPTSRRTATSPARAGTTSSATIPSTRAGPSCTAAGPGRPGRPAGRCPTSRPGPPSRRRRRATPARPRRPAPRTRPPTSTASSRASGGGRTAPHGGSRSSAA